MGKGKTVPSQPLNDDIPPSTPSLKQREAVVKKVVNVAERTERSLKRMDQEAEKLLALKQKINQPPPPEWKNQVDTIWGTIKQIASELWTAAKSVGDDFGYTPKEALKLFVKA